MEYYITLTITFCTVSSFFILLGNSIYDFYLEKANSIIELTVADAGAIKAAFKNGIELEKDDDDVSIIISGSTEDH